MDNENVSCRYCDGAGEVMVEGEAEVCSECQGEGCFTVLDYLYREDLEPEDLPELISDARLFRGLTAILKAGI